MKLVSVVVPNYNCEDLLPKCLDSVINQTYSNLEIIICDNGSEDNSVAVIESYARKDPRIKMLINKENQGLINCYNRMFFEATGDYIMIIDADDWCDLERVEKQAAILNKHDVGLCLTDAFYHSPLFPSSRNERGYSGPIYPGDKETWAPATIMFRREILKTIPGFNTYFDRLTSYDRYFILEILSSFGGYYLDECLYHVWARANSDHRSIDLSDKKAMRKMISEDIYNKLKEQRLRTGTDYLKDNNPAGLKKLEKEMISDKKFIAEKIRKFACIQIDYGHFSNARELLFKAIKTAPFFPRNYQTLLYYFRAQRNQKALNVQHENPHSN